MTPTMRRAFWNIHDPAFNGSVAEPAMIALDAGRTVNGGKPPAELSFGEVSIPNRRRIRRRARSSGPVRSNGS